MGLLSSSEKLSSNLWLAIPIERANSCSSFLLFQITMFKFIVLSSLVLMLCIDSVFPATTVTTTSTSISIYSSTTAVVTKSLCIKTTAGIVACRRRRGILYEKPVMPMDIGLEPAANYFYNGFSIVPMSSLPRIDTDPIGFENLQEGNNYFLSGEPYIKTSLQKQRQTCPGYAQDLLQQFSSSNTNCHCANRCRCPATTETAETTTTTTTIKSTTIETSFSPSAVTVTANCILPPYDLCV